MAYCTQCGAPLEEGTLHDCGSPVAGFTAQPSGKVDRALLLHLLKHPHSGLALSPEKDLMYGWIGMGASVLGFFLYGCSLKRQLVHSVAGSIGSIGKGLFGDELEDAVSGFGNKIPLATHMLLLGAISLIVLLGAFMLLGNWKNPVKLGWQEVVTRLGSMQLATGAGFAVAALIAFVSVKLSLLLLAIVLLVALVMTCLAAADLFHLSAEQRLPVMGLAMALYTVVTLVSASVLLEEAVSSVF